MKAFEEQSYPVSIKVRVIFDDGDEFTDEIKGLNIGHALWRGRWNWPGAVVNVDS